MKMLETLSKMVDDVRKKYGESYELVKICDIFHCIDEETLKWIDAMEEYYNKVMEEEAI